MRKRLKEVRESFNLTQFEFAEKLGVSRTLITQLESGDREVFKPILINSICREFNINKDWFVNGKGKMFNEPLEELQLDDELKELVKMYSSLDEHTKEIVKRFMKSSVSEDTSNK